MAHRGDYGVHDELHIVFQDLNRGLHRLLVDSVGFDSGVCVCVCTSVRVCVCVCEV